MGGVVLRRLMAITGLSLAWALSVAASIGAEALAHDASDGMRHRTFRAKPAIGYRAAAAHRHRRPAVVYRSGEHKVPQISSSVLRRADPQFDELARHCSGSRTGGSCGGTPLRHVGLPDSLLQAPSPATEQNLKQLGIPIVKDVYPIAILRPGSADNDGLTFERR